MKSARFGPQQARPHEEGKVWRRNITSKYTYVILLTMMANEARGAMEIWRG